MSEMIPIIMKHITRHILIQFVIVALMVLGLAQAESVNCLPDCAHCEAAVVVAPCCADMNGHDSDRTDNGADEKTPESCSFGSLCHGNSESEESIVANLIPHIEGLKSPSSHDLQIVTNLQSLYNHEQNCAPFPYKPHLIYTLNCTFLI